MDLREIELPQPHSPFKKKTKIDLDPDIKLREIEVLTNLLSELQQKIKE